MKKHLLILALFLVTTTLAHAQITKTTKNSRGYVRLGLSNFGRELDNLSNFSINNGPGIDEQSSILANMLDGRYGARQGYAFEFGRQYYFNKTSLLPIFDARIGLDWTQLSLTYNEIDFSPFANRDMEAGYEVYGSSFTAASISSKLGPVFSINPISKLVVDVRAQLSATYYANLTDYYAYREGTDEQRYFSFFPEDDEDADGLSALTSIGHLGFKTNFGVTARYGGIGLALDYSPGAIRSTYQSHEGNGEEKFKNNVFQVKISLTL